MSTWRFDGFTLDLAKRELRYANEVRAVQPQVFDLIVYLVENRERVVSKQELLDELWKDTVVTDASLQRAVSLARQALANASRDLIETHARRGYRFVGGVGETVAAQSQWPAPEYVETDDGVHLAWRALGVARGPDIVVVSGWSFPMDGWRKYSRTAASVAALAELGRVILFDRRGVGLSDRLKQPATLAERARDLEAVLDAAGSTSAVIVGFSEGAPLALHHTAEHPERVRGLVIVGGFTRMCGHAAGWTEAQVSALREYMRHGWGKGSTVTAMFPAYADDPDVRTWAADAERTGASPSAARELLDMNLAVDARPLLARIARRTVVLHHRDDRVIHVDNGRELARELRDVRYIEASGSDHTFLLDDADVLLDATRMVSR